MLTPDKIKNKTFQTTGKGSYRAEEVNAFMEEVSASYEQVFRENGEIIKKMSILANKVEEYKKEEDSLRSALLSAQKLADQITAEAQEKADSVVAEAKAKADAIVAEAESNAQKLESDAKTQADAKIYEANKEANEVIGGLNRKVTQEKLVLEMLQREVGAFKNKMMDMYKDHLSLLDRLPSIAAEQAETEAPAEEAPVEETAAEEIAEETTESADDVIEALEDVAGDSDDGFVFIDTEADDEEAETEEEAAAEILTYEPTAALDDTDEFTLDSTSSDEGELVFEDVASGSDEEDGFSLSFDDVDLDDDEEEEVIEPIASEYAPADEISEEKDDEEDDEGFSFKGFFKKK